MDVSQHNCLTNRARAGGGQRKQERVHFKANSQQILSRGGQRGQEQIQRLKDSVRKGIDILKHNYQMEDNKLLSYTLHLTVSLPSARM